MNRSSCFAKLNPLLIIDPSVLVNLWSTHYMEEIVMTLPFNVAVTEIVLKEWEQGLYTSCKNSPIINKLIKRQSVTILNLSENSEEIYLSLITGSTKDSLADAEASTIACALAYEGIIASDDQKSIALCKIRYPQIKFTSTMDLLVSLYNRSQLDVIKLTNALIEALQQAHMHIPPKYHDFVTSKILTYN